MSGTSTSADLWAHSRDEETKESSIKRKNYEPFRSGLGRCHQRCATCCLLRHRTAAETGLSFMRRLANMYKAGKQITLRAKARVSYGAAELADKLDRARRRA